MPTLLVVDDDPFVLRMLERVLENSGFQVLTAGHGLAALEVLRSGQALDLVVSDIEMPVMDGNTFAKEMASEYPEVPILFISGTQGSCPLCKGDRRSYLAKPFTHAALLEAVQRLLWRSRSNSTRQKSQANAAS